MSSIFKIAVLPVFIFALQAFSFDVDPSTSPLCGVWKGPHPEIEHISFLVHIKQQVGGYTANGFWVEKNVFHDVIPMSLQSISDRKMAVNFTEWGCVYSGDLSANKNVINGVFVCDGEAPDSVRLHRVQLSDYYGLYPSHLDMKGGFFYRYKQPKNINDGLQTASAEDYKIDPEIIQEMVTRIALGDYGTLHSFLFLKSGKVICEEYFNGYHRDVLHPMESTTKSITSLLIGIALQEGVIGSVNDPVVDYLPLSESVKLQHRDLTLRHLLTMTSGLAVDEWEMTTSLDRTAFLTQKALEVTPGDKFIYNAANTDLLGVILKSATGLFADDYAEKKLFHFLNISSSDWGLYKNNGYPLCGGSLWLTPRDMAKIGNFILRGGSARGEQIVSKEWLSEAISGIVHTGVGTDAYGYHFWRSEVVSGDQTFSLIWANGMGSQFIFICPQLDMVFVTTGGNWAGGNDGKSWDIFDMFKEYLYKF